MSEDSQVVATGYVSNMLSTIPIAGDLRIILGKSDMNDREKD
jgi:hypothetical protein